MIRGAISFWARSEAGLSRLPVTEEIAGSNPVGPAIENTSPNGEVFSMEVFYFMRLLTKSQFTTFHHAAT